MNPSLSRKATTGSTTESVRKRSRCTNKNKARESLAREAKVDGFAKRRQLNTNTAPASVNAGGSANQKEAACRKHALSGKRIRRVFVDSSGQLQTIHGMIGQRKGNKLEVTYDKNPLVPDSDTRLISHDVAWTGHQTYLHEQGRPPCEGKTACAVLTPQTFVCTDNAIEVTFNGFHLKFFEAESRIEGAGDGLFVEITDQQTPKRPEFVLKAGHVLPMGCYASVDDLLPATIINATTYIYGNRMASAYNFGVSGNDEKVFNVVDMQTGRLHDRAIKAHLVRVNEVVEGQVPDVFVSIDCSKQGFGGVQYFLGHADNSDGDLIIPLDEPKEVLSDYGESYEDNRVDNKYPRIQGIDLDIRRARIAEERRNELHFVAELRPPQIQSLVEFLDDSLKWNSPHAAKVQALKLSQELRKHVQALQTGKTLRAAAKWTQQVDVVISELNRKIEEQSRDANVTLDNSASMEGDRCFGQLSGSVSGPQESMSIDCNSGHDDDDDDDDFRLATESPQPGCWAWTDIGSGKSDSAALAVEDYSGQLDGASTKTEDKNSIGGPTLRQLQQHQQLDPIDSWQWAMSIPVEHQRSELPPKPSNHYLIGSSHTSSPDLECVTDLSFFRSDAAKESTKIVAPQPTTAGIIGDHLEYREVQVQTMTTCENAFDEKQSTPLLEQNHTTAVGELANDENGTLSDCFEGVIAPNDDSGNCSSGWSDTTAWFVTAVALVILAAVAVCILVWHAHDVRMLFLWL